MKKSITFTEVLAVLALSFLFITFWIAPICAVILLTAGVISSIDCKDY